MTVTEILSLTSPSPLQTVLVVCGVLGALFHAYGVFIEKEKNRDMIFAIGGALLLLYALVERNVIFIFTFSVFTISSIWEAVQTSRKK